MSFGGHVQDMLNRAKQNRSLLPSKKAKFKEGQADRTQGLKRGGPALRFKKVDQEKLAALKEGIQQKKQRHRRLEYIFLSLLSIATLGLLGYWLLF